MRRLLGDILKGRTTYAMSAEVAKPARIDLLGLQPGDVVFFGAKGPKSTPAEVGHMGIYVGNGWFVHSSSVGVTLQPLAGLVHEDVRLGEAAAPRGGAHSLSTSDRARERVALPRVCPVS